MALRSIKLILLVLCVDLLVACQPSLNSHPSGKSRPSPEASPDLGSRGTSDRGGGGNLINGKPIEAYIVDIRTLPEYLKYIEPIDVTLGIGSDTGFSFLQAAIANRTWYVVPVELSTLGPDQIGVSFESTQGARQSGKEIFISGPVYSKLAEKDKAILLLHEIIMSLYRFKYESMESYCKAYFNNDPKKANCINSLLDSKHKDLWKPVVSENFLEPDEYEAIRSVTAWIFTEGSQLSRSAFDRKLHEKKFDPRIFTAGSAQSDGQEKPIFMDKNEIYNAITRQLNTNTFPKHCGFKPGSLLVATATCKFTFNQSQDSIQLSVEVEGQPNTRREYNVSFRPWQLKDENFGKIFTVPRFFRSGLSMYEAKLADVLKTGWGPLEGMKNNISVFIEKKEFEIQIVALKFERTYTQADVTDDSNGTQYSTTQIKPTNDELMTYYIDRNPKPPIQGFEIDLEE